MKYIKKYENLNNDNKPQVGDYVYCDVVYESNYNPTTFVGRIVSINPEKSYPYKIEYPLFKDDNEDDDNENNYRLVKRNEIIDFAKTLEEMEHYLDINKYNL